MTVDRIICILIGYAIGLFQTGYIYGKTQHIDIREHGSGNAGTTNTLRTLGFKAGAITFAGDCGKAILAIFISWLIFHAQYPEGIKLLGMYAGLADTRAKILTDLLKQNKGTLLFLGDTIQEREIGARVCAAMGWPGWNHIVSVESEGERKRIRRLAYGKCLLEEISLRQPSVMSFLLRPRQLANGTGGELVSYSADHIRPFGQAECVEEIREPVEDIDLEKAEIVIGGGNGLGGRENFELLRELAIRLGGAVAATRPVIEAGWAPRNRQVGQSGKSISPELYLAFGISGASQHISGMINAKYVVAVNTDAEAPIFQYADYGIVGDVNEILPKLLQDLK